VLGLDIVYREGFMEMAFLRESNIKSIYTYLNHDFETNCYRIVVATGHCDVNMRDDSKNLIIQSHLTTPSFSSDCYFIAGKSARFNLRNEQRNLKFGNNIIADYFKNILTKPVSLTSGTSTTTIIPKTTTSTTTTTTTTTTITTTRTTTTITTSTIVTTTKLEKSKKTTIQTSTTTTFNELSSLITNSTGKIEQQQHKDGINYAEILISFKKSSTAGFSLGQLNFSSKLNFTLNPSIPTTKTTTTTTRNSEITENKSELSTTKNFLKTTRNISLSNQNLKKKIKTYLTKLTKKKKIESDYINSVLIKQNENITNLKKVINTQTTVSISSNSSIKLKSKDASKTNRQQLQNVALVKIILPAVFGFIIVISVISLILIFYARLKKVNLIFIVLDYN
jgi:hypothetical protein